MLYAKQLAIGADNTQPLYCVSIVHYDDRTELTNRQRDMDVDKPIRLQQLERLAELASQGKPLFDRG